MAANAPPHKGKNNRLRRISVHWSEEQDRALENLLQKLLKINDQLTAQVQRVSLAMRNYPQAAGKIVFGCHGGGICVNSTAHTRLGKPNLDLMHKIVGHPTT
jgi:hypothetical protein